VVRLVGKARAAQLLLKRAPVYAQRAGLLFPGGDATLLQALDLLT
jgi:hypothetical protein